MSGSSRRAPRSAAGERLGVQADFAMVDQAALALVDEFDRVFDRDDVILARLVRVIHDRRQRRGLAAAGRAGDEDESLVQLGELFHDRRQAQLFGREDLRGNLAEDRGNAVLLVEEVGAETGHAGNFVAEVDVAGFFEDLDLVLRRDLVEHRLERVVLQRRVTDSLHFAANAHDGLRARSQVQVRGPDLHHEVEKRVNLRHRPSQNQTGLLGERSPGPRISSGRVKISSSLALFFLAVDADAGPGNGVEAERV